MKSLSILMVVLMLSIALLLAGCSLATPEIPECPDCICPECPDCVCPCVPGCPDIPECPGCECECECPTGEPPIIVLFEAEPATPLCLFPWTPITISWVVTGADAVNITPDIGYVDVTGNYIVGCWELGLGENLYTLTATNTAGSVIGTITITKTIP